MISRSQITNVTSAKDFVGLKIQNKQISLFVPEAFYVSEDDKVLKKDLLLFLRSINIAKTKEHSAIMQSEINDVDNIWSIDSYLWLINDFVENGYYYPIEKENKKSINGKINWKKTLKTTPKVIDNKVFYTDYFVTKSYPANTEITDIYKFCLKIAIDRIGWIFNINVHIEILNQYSIKRMKYIINQANNNTFDDIKRLRFSHMIKILNNVNESYKDSNNCTYGIYHYNYVFEKMVDQMFGNVSDFRKVDFFPKSKWILSLDNKKKVNSPLELDTLYLKNDYAYIIDSKLYGYGITRSDKELPETQSVQKQITYADYLFHIGYKNIRNIFILPYNKNLNPFDLHGNIEFFGYSIPEWRTIRKEYEYILGYFIDFNYLLRNYKKHNFALFENIETRLKEIS